MSNVWLQSLFTQEWSGCYRMSCKTSFVCCCHGLLFDMVYLKWSEVSFSRLGFFERPVNPGNRDPLEKSIQPQIKSLYCSWLFHLANCGGDREKKIFAFGTNLQALSQSKPITKRVDIDCSPLHIDWLQVGSVCGICQLLSAQHNSHSSSRDRVDFSMVAIPLIKLCLAARSVWSIYFQCAGDHAAKPSLWIFSLPFCHVCLSSWHARYIQG